MDERRRVQITLGIATSVLTAVALSDLGMPARASVIAAVCLLLWLTGLVPVWAPTLVLWIATPLLLAGFDGRFAPVEVLRWSADPVLALFLGGFALAAAARRHGVDVALASIAQRRAGNSATKLVAAAAFSTALLSMWMSNVAAAALMLNAFRPIWEREPLRSPLRRSLLLVIALAADVGGIATPIGTGANGIAMAAVAHVRPISFIHWMAFGVPLALGLVCAAVVLVVIRLRPTASNTPLEVTADAAVSSSQPAGEFIAAIAIGSTQSVSESTAPVAIGLPPIVDALPARHTRKHHHWLGAIFVVTIILWLSEPLHGAAAWLVALAAVVALLAFRVLHWRDLVKLDWGTLLLVAGGIGMGALLDNSGIVREWATALPLGQMSPLLRIFGICLLSALLASLMSNTGTAALLIPLAASIDPSPSTAILVAVAASLGMPFVISTPPNAMAVAGGLKSSDLLWPGLILMLGGCAVIALTGPFVLRAVGLP